MAEAKKSVFFESEAANPSDSSIKDGAEAAADISELNNAESATEARTDRIVAAALENVILSANALRERKKKTLFEKRMRNLSCCAALIVVLSTTVALMFPALAYEAENESPVEQSHTHTIECYTQVSSTTELVLSCTAESAGVHSHSSECYDGNGKLICGLADYVVHTHTQDCYDENDVLVCTLPIVEAHTHTDACYTASRGELVCKLNESSGHTHLLSCYDAEGNCICGLEESAGHTHTEDCYEKVLTLSCTKEEIVLHTHSASCYDKNGELICGKLQVKSHTHGTDCFTSISIPVDTQTLTCTLSEDEGHTHILSCYDAQGNIVCGLTESDGHTHSALCYGKWVLTCPFEESAAQNEVAESIGQLLPTDLISQSDVASASDASTLTEEEQAQVDDIIERIEALPSSDDIDSALTAYEEAEDADGYDYYCLRYTLRCEMVYMLYEELSQEQKALVSNVDRLLDSQWFWGENQRLTSASKASKDNSNKLSTVKGMDTSELIEINLYDYNSSINDLWRSNSKYPGFQQDSGQLSVSKIYHCNFGNNITTDLDAGASVTNKGGDINTTNSAIAGTANAPISGALSLLMGEDGYPALSDGTSLAYLFSNSGYATKLNSRSINYLFQQNSSNGVYYYNSRINHAQFNASDDTFTLYDQIITSNYMMYPFGNFLPLNDIVNESAQVSTANGWYLYSIAQSALSKSSKSSDAYYKLAYALDAWISLVDTAQGTYNWEYDAAVDAYFNGAKPTKDSSTSTYQNVAKSYYSETGKDLAQNLYCIDFDEATNFFFGMEIKTTLTQPKNGVVAFENSNGEVVETPMHFYFTGDDDVWVYIDDVLFLDLSGIHRHVGGEIDFEKGVVYYYALNTATGDISSSPYAKYTFEQILEAAGASTDCLNSNGTFINYTQHSFHFYYMERGAGSGVCRINFNFPFLDDNSISVGKALSVDADTVPEGAEDVQILGDPDFKFQVVKADVEGEPTDELYIGEGIEYNILSGSDVIGTGVTGANGVISIKAGQTACFPDIREDSGPYFIRELLEESDYEQYGDIQIDGNSCTVNNNVTVSTNSFKGILSNLADISNGNTSFTFENIINFQKLGTLSIAKKLNTFDGTVDENMEFDVYVSLDGEALPVGTMYLIGEQTHYVSTAGIITLKADQTAYIPYILSGSKYSVCELSESAAGFAVEYSGNGDFTTDGASASGSIDAAQTSSVLITNDEVGATITLNGSKSLVNPDGQEHSYTITLTPVTDMSGVTAVEGESPLVANVVVGADGYSEFFFSAKFTEREFNELPATRYYRIAEIVDNALVGRVDFDPTVYTVQIDITKDENKLNAEIVGMKKDGADIEPDAEIPLVFANTLLCDFTLSKTLCGLIDDGSLFYSFNVKMTFNEKPLTGTYRATTPQGHITFDESGEATVVLTPDASVMIYGLPMGADWTLTEIDCDDYHVTWTRDSGEVSTGNTAMGRFTSVNSSVNCTNIYCYELPSTGGSGPEAYIICGMMLMAFALLVLLQKECRKLYRRKA